MTDFDAIYVEDLAEDVPLESTRIKEAGEPIVIRGIGEITM